MELDIQSLIVERVTSLVTDLHCPYEGLGVDSTNPDGSQTRLAISSKDGKDTSIELVQIFLTNGVVFREIQLKKIKDVYVTENFMPPNSTFLISVKFNSNGKTFMRFARTPIVPHIIPKIDQSSKAITSIKPTSVEIKCRILKGLPKPSITWKFKSLTSDTPKTLPDRGESIKIGNVNLSDAGQYTCEARNNFGVDHKTVELTVTAKPVVSITSDKGETTLDYNSKVTASPKPNIMWMNSTGAEVMIPKMEKVGPFEYASQLIVTNIKKPGDITFFCKASNYLGETIKKYKITVKLPFTTNNTTVNKTVNYGDAVQLPCDIEASVPLKFSWFRKHGDEYVELKPTNNATISPDRKHLTIKKVLLTTESFECKAVIIGNEDISKTITFNITTLRIAPKIDQSNKNLTVKENTTVEIKCRILKAVPEADIIWKFKSMKSGALQTLSESGKSIKIENVGLNNAGLYTCESNNIRGTDYKHINLNVKAKPVVTITSDTGHTVEYNSTVTLSCKVTASPKPDIMWTNSSTAKPVRTNEMKAEGGFEYTRQLYVPTIKRSSDYVCTASNDMGYTAQNYSFTVTLPFDILNDTKVDQPVNYSDAVELSCDIKASVPLKYSWFMKHGDESVKLKPTNNVAVSSDGRHLTIKNASFINESYECRASIIGDEDIFNMKTFNVGTHGIKPEIDQSNRTITAKENSTVYIKCSITSGQPKPDIKWLFTSTRSTEPRELPHTEETMTKKNVTLEDAGKYTCQAKNPFGDRNKTVELIVTAAPQILKNDTSLDDPYIMFVDEQELFKLSCRITKGMPTPKIMWEYKLNEAKNYEEMTDKTEDIEVRAPSTGEYHYRCTAYNDAGSDEKIIKVVVNDNTRQ